MDVDLKFDYAEALRRQNFSQSCVDSLRDAVNRCESLPKSLTDKQLLLFLGKSNGCIEKSIKTMQRYYEIKRKNPQIFRNRDVDAPEIKQSLENQFYFNLPLTKYNQIVCFHALSNSNPKAYHYNNATNCFLMMIETALSIYGPRRGIILIYDMTNFRFGHLTRNNIKSMKGFFAFVQEGMPISIDEIHIFNTFPSFSLVMKLISPFMRADIVKKMHLHSSGIDLENFHTKYISKSSLPCDSDYGGSCESAADLHKKHIGELLGMRAYFEAEEKQVFG